MIRAAVISGLLFAAPALAQIDNPPNVDAAVAAAIPPFAATVPAQETVAGAAGVANTIRRGDSVQPRITRAGSCTLNAGGNCTVTWTNALASAPMLIITPVNPSASQPITCNTTATPTTTSASVQCWIDQTSTLAAVTVLGVSVAVGSQVITPATSAPAGTVVQVIAIPAAS